MLTICFEYFIMKIITKVPCLWIKFDELILEERERESVKY